MPDPENTHGTRVEDADEGSVPTDMTPRSPDPCVDAIASDLGNMSLYLTAGASQCSEDDDAEEDYMMGSQAPEFCRPGRQRARRGSMVADDDGKALASGESAPRLLSLSNASPRSSTSSLERMVSERPPTPDSSPSTVPGRRSSRRGRRQIMHPRNVSPPRSVPATEDTKAATLLPVSTYAELTEYPPEARQTYLEMLKTAADYYTLWGQLRQLERSRSRSRSQSSPLYRRALCTSSLLSTHQSSKDARESVLNYNKNLLAQWPQLHVASLTDEKDDKVEQLGREALDSDLASSLCGELKLVSAHTI